MSELVAFLVRMSPDLRDRVAARAAADDLSMAQVVRRALRFYLAETRREGEHPALDAALCWFAPTPLGCVSDLGDTSDLGDVTDLQATTEVHDG